MRLWGGRAGQQLIFKSHVLKLQGAVIVDAKRSYGPRYMGYDKNRTLKSRIAEILKNNEYCKIIADEPDKLYTCSIHIKNEAKKKMTEEEQQQVYISVRNDIWRVFGQDGLFIAMAHNCMEVGVRIEASFQVMHKEISKARALEVILTTYRKKYDVVGMCMCGDAENDKVALLYMSRMAEVPGVRAHVFTPSNAQRAVSTSVLEGWKNTNPNTSRNRIRKSQFRLFRGITDLIRDELAKNTLVGDGVQRWSRSYDELDIPQKRPTLALML